MNEDPNQGPYEPGQPPNDQPAAAYEQASVNQPSPNPFPAPPGGGPYGTYTPSASPGFNVQTLVQRWQNVLLRPSVPTFDAEQPAANWQTILISLALLGVVEAVGRFISGLEASSLSTFTLPNGTTVPIHVNPARDAVGGLIGAFVGFFVLSGILYISAKIFSGQGSFLTHSWLLSLFYVPLNAIAALVGIIPLIGGLVGFAAVVYSVYLAVLAMASAHRMPTGRAAAVVLLPLAVLVVLACVLALALAALIVAIMHNVGY